MSIRFPEASAFFNTNQLKGSSKAAKRYRKVRDILAKVQEIRETLTEVQDECGHPSKHVYKNTELGLFQCMACSRLFHQDPHYRRVTQ